MIKGRRPPFAVRRPPRIQMRRSAATDSRFDYDRVPFVMNSGYAQRSRRDALTGRPLRYRIQAIKNERSSQVAVHRRPVAKKYTAEGLVRRGFRVGSPLERFNHSLFRYNGRLL